jgi:hypothetical protein
LLRAPDYATFRRYKIIDPAPNTLGWFINKPEYLLWQNGKESSLLWIQGSAGQGKTILTKFLLNYLEDIAKTEDTVIIYFFFYEQDDTLRTVGAALRALVRQLLSARGADAFSVISAEVELEGSHIEELKLWNVLEELLKAPLTKQIFCVVDGLDELPDLKMREEFISFFRNLTVWSKKNRASATPVLKTLMISRPANDIYRLLNKSLIIGLEANPHDLQAFVYQELAFLREQWDDKQHATVVEMLIGRTEQTFLWISLVVRRLKAAALLTMAEIKAIISASPSSLDDFYDNIVKEIMGRDGDIPKKILLWAVYWRRPLTLAELEEAISVQPNSISIASTSDYRLPLDKNKNSLSGAIGVIVSISDDNKVHLTHQSVKDYLVNSSYLISAEFCRGLGPNLYLAQVCMLFLCFPDSDIDPHNDGRIGFLEYAAWNWHRHIENDLSNISSLEELIARITKPKSPEFRRWVRYAGLSANLGNATELWDIAVGANISWLGSFQNLATEKSVDAKRVVDAAAKGAPGYTAFLHLSQNAEVKFTDDAVCEMVRLFDQPVIRAYYDSRKSLPKTQELCIAAMLNARDGETLSILRFLLVALKENGNEKLVVDKQVAKHLIQYSVSTIEGENRSVHMLPESWESTSLSVVLRILVRDETVEFNAEGWAEFFLSQEPVDPLIIFEALESRQDCSWEETLRLIIKGA